MQQTVLDLVPPPEVIVDPLPLMELSNTRIPDSALKVLRGAVITGNIVSLPPAELDRAIYKKVSQALELLGGRWSRGAFRFPYDPEPLLAEVLEKGRYPRRNPGAFFPTPDQTCEDIITWLDIPGELYWDHVGPMKVLDPNGGGGAFLKAAKRLMPWAELYAVELDGLNCAELMACGVKVIQGDFLHPAVQAQVKALGPFDLVLANPPFDGLDWAKHNLAALELVGRDRWCAFIYPQASMLNRGRESLIQQWRNAIGTHCGKREPLPKKDTGFPVDCEVAYFRTNSASEEKALREPEEGYPSVYCFRMMISLSCEADYDKEIYVDDEGNESKVAVGKTPGFIVSQDWHRLDARVNSLWETYSCATWLWDDQVKLQVMQEIRELAEARNGKTD